MRFRIAVLLTSLIAGAVGPLDAQSLAAVAKKEEERRKDAPPSKAYSNKDLKPAPAPAPVPAPADAQAADSKPVLDAKAAADAKGKDKSQVRDQAYWSGRITSLREQLDRDKIYAEALQSRINALTADFSARDDPAQRDRIGVERQKAVAELDRLRKQIVVDAKAIVDAEEEARRAGVPPGWLR